MLWTSRFKMIIQSGQSQLYFNMVRDWMKLYKVYSWLSPEQGNFSNKNVSILRLEDAYAAKQMKISPPLARLPQ